MNHPIVVFCLLLSSPLCASAEVYKCVDAQNRVSFSQQPCAVEQTSKIVTPKLAADAVGLSELKLSHYEFTAPDSKGAFLKIKQLGPQGFWGMANWQVSYKYVTKQRATHCTVESVTTQISGTIWMPKWADVSAAPPSHQKWWADAMLGLKHHEDGHIQHGRQLSDALRNQLQVLQFASCSEVPAAADQHFNRLLEIYRKKDVEYDRATNHGMTQLMSVN